MGITRRYGAALVSLVVLLLLGCQGVVFWKTVYSKKAVDGKEVQLQIKGCLADCAVQVIVIDGWRSKQVARANDCWIAFAHAAWSGPVVALFADGTYCGQIKVAYDTADHVPVDFSRFKRLLGESIIREYGVTKEELAMHSGDVFKWATYPGDGNARRSSDEFRRRYPQF